MRIAAIDIGTNSVQLIKNGDLRGVEPDKVEVIALTARSHRRGRPKQRTSPVRTAVAGAAPRVARRRTRHAVPPHRVASPPSRMTNRITFAAMVVAASAVLAGATVAEAQDNELIVPGGTVERVRTGFGFLEGPAADADGNLYFSDVVNERIHYWSPATGIIVFRERTGQANGLRVDVDGTLLVCEMANRQLTAIDQEGRRTVLADRYEGQRFNSPNDLWVDPRGGIYFSDPRYGPTDDQEISGNHVYYLSPNRETLLRVTDDLVQPNGIIGTPDGSRVYIADQGAGRLWAYRPEADGSLGDKRLFVSQGADGMTMDERGNLYLTSQDITIFDPTGRQIGSIGVPEPPANLAFGGPDGMTLFITARRSLYRVDMLVTGQ